MSFEDRQDGAGRRLANRQPVNDFAQVLLRTIEAFKDDPAQVRNLIYEQARAHLQREAWQTNPSMNILELRRLMLTLETAIERVETVSSENDATPRLAAPVPSETAAAEIMPTAPDLRMSTRDDAAPNFRMSTRDDLVVIDQGRLEPITVVPTATEGAREKQTTRLTAQFTALMQLCAIAAVAAGVVVLVDREFHVLSRAPTPAVATIAPPPQGATPNATMRYRWPTGLAQAPAAANAVVAAPGEMPAAPPAPSGPLPSVYGIYAVSDGKLYELEQLAGRVPDQRVFMSSVIKAPSHTVLPDGRVTFIIYRRDIASSAPDHVTVRVIAKVVREMTFSNAGKATTAAVDDAWAIRNVSFDYRVAPMSESPEMIEIKPEGGTSALLPGRYGLVIKGFAYDFTVSGAITATAQCLERTEAANGTFYTECRKL